MTAMLTLQSRRVGIAAIVAAAILVLSAPAASAHDPRSCLVEVLYSEELPLGPLFHHTVRARLFVTPADGPPFEMTVERVISWQAPPPRRGQRIWMACEQVLAQGFHLF